MTNNAELQFKIHDEQPRLARSLSHPLLLVLVFCISGTASFVQSNDKVPRVTVVNPVKETLVYRLPSKPAEMLAIQEAIIYARTSGYLDQISVDIGDSVEKGQVVAVLDTPELTDDVNVASAQVLEARAHHAAAQAVANAGASKILAADADFTRAKGEILQASAELRKAGAVLEAQKVHTDRIRRLHRQEAATDAQLETAEKDHLLATADVEVSQQALKAAETKSGAAAAMVTVAQAEWNAKVILVSVAETAVTSATARADHARTMLGYAIIRAPFSGVITDRFLDPGAAVVTSTSSKTTAIVTLKDLSSIKIYVQIPEPDVPYIHKGHSAEITCSAYPNRRFEGVVSRISRDLDRRTRTMKVEILLPNEDGQIYPGMFATVNFDLIERVDAWTLPAQALLGSKGEYHVYCVVGGVCRAVPIKIGLDDGRTVEITEGLNGDEQVILIGKGLVQAGDRVEAVGSNP